MAGRSRTSQETGTDHELARSDLDGCRDERHVFHRLLAGLGRCACALHLIDMPTAHQYQYYTYSAVLKSVTVSAVR